MFLYKWDRGLVRAWPQLQTNRMWPRSQHSSWDPGTSQEYSRWVSIIQDGTCTHYRCEMRYVCEAGFTVVGRKSILCQADGTWTRTELPTCIPVQCQVSINRNYTQATPWFFDTRFPIVLLTGRWHSLRWLTRWLHITYNTNWLISSVINLEITSCNNPAVCHLIQM